MNPLLNPYLTPMNHPILVGETLHRFSGHRSAEVLGIPPCVACHLQDLKDLGPLVSWPDGDGIFHA
jgi:hypothetical protein